MSDAWHERLKNIGEATGEPPPPTLTRPRPRRQRTLHSLLSKPERDFSYFYESLGRVDYNLVANDEDYLCYLATIRDSESNILVPRWTTLVWIFKERCEHHDQLLHQYKLTTPERVIHTNPMLTSEYVRTRGNLDWILNGIKQNFGYEPYSAL